MKTISTTFVLFFFIFLFNNSHLFAQKEEIEYQKQIIKSAKNDTTIIAAYYNIGEIYFYDDPKTAGDYYKKSQALAEKVLAKQSNYNAQEIYVSRDYLANCVNNIGMIVYSNGDVNKAMELFQRGLKLEEENNKTEGIGGCLNNIGYMYMLQGDNDVALEYYYKSLKTYQQIGETEEGKRGVAGCLNNIGSLLEDRGDVSTAFDNYQKSLKIWEELGDKFGIAECNNNIGLVYFNRGEISKATEFIKVGLKNWDEAGDKSGVAKSYNNLGQIAFTQGDAKKALEYYNKSQTIKEELQNFADMPTTYNNMAAVYNSLGDIPKSVEYYLKALNINEQMGNKFAIALSYNNLGLLYYYQGDVEKGLEYFQKSLKIKESLGDKGGMATALGNIGSYYNDLALKKENPIKTRDSLLTIALDYYQKGYKFEKETEDNKGMEVSLHNIGAIYDVQGNLSKATEYYEKSLVIGEKIGNKSTIAQTNINLGYMTLYKNEMTISKKHAQKAYDIAKEIGYPSLIRGACKLLMSIYMTTKEYKKADPYALEIIEIDNKSILINFSVLSEREKELYYKTIESDYMVFNSYALQRKDENPSITETVYNNTLKNKGLLLKSSTAMRNAVLSSNDKNLIENYEKWLFLKQQIAKAYSEGQSIVELEEKANQLEKELVKSSTLFSDFKKVQQLSWKDVQKALKPNEAAIEFVQFVNSADEMTDTILLYCALVVKPDIKYPEMIQLFEEKQLEKILGISGGNNLGYVNTVYGKSSESKQALYNLIWKPLEESLKSSKAVFISPTGLLHKVAFSAINKVQNIFLCDVYDIKIQTSTGKVAFPESFVFDTKLTASIFGGINYDSGNSGNKIWGFLKGTKSETETITSILKKEKVSVNYLTDFGATEEEFKKIAGNSSILHIATHGFFYPDPEIVVKETKAAVEPGTLAFRGAERSAGVNSFVVNKNPMMRSGLVFAGANDVWNKKENATENDGVLTAEEVANIDMRKTGLVVLSACESGLGDIKAGEGVYGLQRSFKMAGVNYMIMSLWQVPDKETEEFMIAFYTKLMLYKNTRRAFSETQKEMRTKYDPYFWAAFVLVE